MKPMQHSTETVARRDKCGILASMYLKFVKLEIDLEIKLVGHTGRFFLRVAFGIPVNCLYWHRPLVRSPLFAFLNLQSLHTAS